MWQAGFPWMRPTRVQLGVLSAANRAQRAGYLHQASLRLGLFWEPNSPILGDFWTWKPPIFFSHYWPISENGTLRIPKVDDPCVDRPLQADQETSACHMRLQRLQPVTWLRHRFRIPAKTPMMRPVFTGDGSILWWYSCQLLWCSKLLYSGCLLNPLWLVPGLLSCRLVVRSLALGIVDNKAGRARTAPSTSGISSFQGEFFREMGVLFEHGVPNPLVNHQFPIEMAGCYTPLWDIPTSGIALLPPGIDWASV